MIPRPTAPIAFRNSPDRPRSSGDLTAACISLALALLTGFVFSPVLTSGTIGPDDAAMLRAGRLAARSGSDAASVFARYQTPEDTAGYYQPLTILSFTIDAVMTRDPVARIFQAHLLNLLLHIINTSLLFTLLCRAYSLRAAPTDPRRVQGATSTNYVWPALWSLLFAVHPVQVESVAWISQRMTLLATFFSLLSILAYLRYRSTDRTIWIIGATIACAAAILSKPTFIGLPIVLMVLDFWPIQRPLRGPLAARLPLLTILILAAAVQFMILRQATMRTSAVPAPLELFARTFAIFVTRVFWPIGLLPFNPLEGWTAASHVVIWRDLAISSLLIVLPAWAYFRFRPLFAAGVGGLLFLGPAFLNTPFTEMQLSDQYLYPVLIPTFIVLTAWIGEHRPTLRSPMVRCTAMVQFAVIAVFAVLSYSQSLIWQSSRSLFSAIVRTHPTWPHGHIGLIEAVIAEGDYDVALQAAQRAVQVAPEDASTQFYLGTALLLQTGSRAGEAIAPLRKALASNPNWIGCLQNLGVALARCGRFDKAIKFLERARDLEPNSAGIRLSLGNSYLRVHRPSSARGELQEALRLKNDPVTQLSLAAAWAANGSLDRARLHLAAAVAKDPRMSARAAANEELRRLRNQPGFESLIDDRAGGPERFSSDLETPAARKARGS